MGINSKDKRDVYYYKAKAMGYRARSAFKLLDIQSKFNIFDNATNIVDLCAAPGSWSQVLSMLKYSKIVAVDVQDMIPIDNVTILKEDITSRTCLDKIKEIFNGESADLIVFDGAPDVTGFHDLDEYLQSDLLKSALEISLNIGKEGSTFVGKCFRGEYTGYLVKHFMNYFETVDVVKPKSSRGASVECFLLCRKMIKCMKNPKIIDVKGNPIVFKVLDCGDGPDPDYTFEDAKNYRTSNAPPLNPPYKDAVNIRKSPFQ